MRKRAQGAFEYILLLAGVLLVVVLAIVILRSSVLPAAQQQVGNNTETVRQVSCLPTYIKDPASVAGWWKLDDGGGTEARDSSGRGNHGTLTGSSAWTAGVLGGGLNFPSGVTSNVDIPNSDNLLPAGSSFTIEAWVNRQAPGNTNYVVIKSGAYWMSIANTKMAKFSYSARENKGLKVPR